jgi:hypothetical protein
MADRTKSVGFSVSAREKEAIRQAAATEGVSMAEFARRRVLDNITPDEPEFPGDEPDPLDDFITARLHTEIGAGPLPKQAVYEAYQEFCADLYPDHEIESQHKVSREVGALTVVETGRNYIEGDDGLEQKRCFRNVRCAQR